MPSSNGARCYLEPFNILPRGLPAGQDSSLEISALFCLTSRQVRGIFQLEARGSGAILSVHQSYQAVCVCNARWFSARADRWSAHFRPREEPLETDKRAR